MQLLSFLILPLHTKRKVVMQFQLTFSMEFVIFSKHLLLFSFQTDHQMHGGVMLQRFFDAYTPPFPLIQQLSKSAVYSGIDRSSLCEAKEQRPQLFCAFAVQEQVAISLQLHCIMGTRMYSENLSFIAYSQVDYIREAVC